MFSESDVAQAAGAKFVEAYNEDRGLPGSAFVEFARALGLRTEAPQNFLPIGYSTLLKTYGPLWVGARVDAATDRSRRHIRVLRGITGDGTFDGSVAWVLDPDGGRDYQVSVTQFEIEMETIAREEITAGSDLFPQVIRFR